MTHYTFLCVFVHLICLCPNSNMSIHTYINATDRYHIFLINNILNIICSLSTLNHLLLSQTSVFQLFNKVPI